MCIQPFANFRFCGMSQTGDGNSCSFAQSVEDALGITVKDTGLSTAGLPIPFATPLQ
jgi:hypothetical protein